MDDWSDYLICLAVVETGSLTAAAASLDVSQPTVSRRIKALEQRLGDPLFQRQQGELQPTLLGRKIADHATRMREEALSIQRAAVAMDQRLTGLVSVSASEGVGADWLPKALAGFQRANPGLAVDVQIKNHTANLADREADIALRWNGPGSQQSLIGRRGATVGAGLYASHDYLDRHGAPERAEDLADHAAVAWSMVDYFPWPSNAQGVPVLPRNIAYKTNSPAAHVRGVAAGYGLGVTSHRLAREYGNLVRVLPEFSAALDLWVVAHETVRRSARIRACFDHIIDAMRRDAAYFEAGRDTVLDQAAAEPA